MMHNPGAGPCNASCSQVDRSIAELLLAQILINKQMLLTLSTEIEFLIWTERCELDIPCVRLTLKIWDFSTKNHR